MSLSDHFKVLSHHAYCIPGDPSVCLELKTLLADEHSIPSQANPDFYERSYQTFTIDDARNLKSLHETRPIGNTGKKIFIVVMNSITNEAQNALLKLLEEPSPYAHFFLIVPSAHVLLPTVKSRLLLIGHDSSSENNAEEREAAGKFLKMPAGKKLDHIKKLMDDISKEKKTRQDAISFLNAVEHEVYATGSVKDHERSLEAITFARKYIHDRAPSVKMLLEYMTLNQL
jgi:DNA polymerase III delta prime subunit